MHGDHAGRQVVVNSDPSKPACSIRAFNASLVRVDMMDSAVAVAAIVASDQRPSRGGVETVASSRRPGRAAPTRASSRTSARRRPARHAARRAPPPARDVASPKPIATASDDRSRNGSTPRRIGRRAKMEPRSSSLSRPTRPASRGCVRQHDATRRADHLRGAAGRGRRFPPARSGRAPAPPAMATVALPPAVQPGRHEVVHEVVARRDRVNTPAHAPPLPCRRCPPARAREMRPVAHFAPSLPALTANSARTNR